MRDRCGHLCHRVCVNLSQMVQVLDSDLQSLGVSLCLPLPSYGTESFTFINGNNRGLVE